MGSIETSNYRRRRKENLIKVCGSKCNICGYDKTKTALEFHHIQPEGKIYAIASKGTCHDLKTDLEEVKKCIMVCANCHREIHDDFYDEDFLLNKKIFDENFANLLIEEKENREVAKHYYCSKCGKEITRYSKSGLCEECLRFESRIVERPSREELKNMIRTQTFVSIAKQYNVSDKAIVKWCKAENLPFRKKDIVLYSDVQWAQV